MTARPADSGAGDGQDDVAAIHVRLGALLTERGMTLAELSERVGVTIVNLSILKNGRARAIRFSTLTRLCEALHCQPGDLLSYQPSPPARMPGAPPGIGPASALRSQPERAERRKREHR